MQQNYYYYFCTLHSVVGHAGLLPVLCQLALHSVVEHVGLLSVLLFACFAICRRTYRLIVGASACLLCILSSCMQAYYRCFYLPALHSVVVHVGLSSMLLLVCFAHSVSSFSHLTKLFFIMLPYKCVRIRYMVSDLKFLNELHSRLRKVNYID